MTDLRRRLEALPAGLRDGAWAHCSLRVTGGRLYVGEASDTVRQRRREGLRRRLILTLLGGLALLAIPALRGPAQVGAGMLGSLLLLAALDGLRGDLRAGALPRQFAILDPDSGELALLRAGGGGVAIPLDKLKMILVVRDTAHQVCHLGVVVEDEALYWPWIHTRSEGAAVSLAWLLGYFCERPAGRLESGLPPRPEAIGEAVPIPRPQQATAL